MKTTSWLPVLALALTPVGCARDPVSSGIYVVACATTGEDTYAWDKDNDGALEADCLLPPAYQDCDDDSPEVGLAPLQYPDCDRDGDGDSNAAPDQVTCGATAIFNCSGGDLPGVLNSDDCNDAAADIHADAPERCDGKDNDCDGEIEGPADGGGDELDEDGDGARTCGGDCDDMDATIGPNGPDFPEICDGKDNNCDGGVDVNPAEGEGSQIYPDADADTYGDTDAGEWACIAGGPLPEGYVFDGTDCDDADNDVHPGAADSCDGQDNDCDGETDEDKDTQWYPDCDGDGQGEEGVSGLKDCERPADTPTCSWSTSNDDCNDNDPNVVATKWYYDADNDGYGNPENFVSSCDPPDEDFVSNGDDCVDGDGDATVHQGAPELCDGKDNDCDGTSDEDFDKDADGFFTCGTGQDGTADCDDTNAGINPNATETCDGVDNNCAGGIDEGFDKDKDGDNDAALCDPPNGNDCNDNDPNNSSIQGEKCDGKDNDCDNTTSDEGIDADGDGYAACSSTGGTSNDCDDNDPNVKPGATETCDGKDTNCDGVIPADEADKDNDGFMVCEGDCDDEDPNDDPEGNEVCDGDDNDCDGKIDEGVTSPWYKDSDGDGYGTEERKDACQKPEGYSSLTGDCKDTDDSINPSADEVCDSEDNNCDGATDEGFDTDRDSYTTCETIPDCKDSDPNINPGEIENCQTEVDDDCDGKVNVTDTDGDGYNGCVDSEDCNDAVGSIHAGAGETCNGADDDCDGTEDEDVKTTYYLDGDGDGYGTAESTTQACSRPAYYVTNSNDCDDGNAEIKPSAPEKCDGNDNNCDGQIDEGKTVPRYLDQDQDGYGAGSELQKCEGDPNMAERSGDCDDNNRDINPGVPKDSCNGGVDDDCDGQRDEDADTIWYYDDDQDGFGVTTQTTKSCTQPLEYAAQAGDCNDNDGTIRPGAAEQCDSKDNDCDGSTDEGLMVTWYRDQDSDGWGIESLSQVACSQPQGYVSKKGDCNDNNGSINPAAPETCDYIDNDCDGSVDTGLLTITYYQDADDDGYGANNMPVLGCASGPPTGAVSNNRDCNDANDAVNPDATEVCDLQDNDCDGQMDEGVKTTYYRDGDGDGYGGSATTSQACSAPTGYVANDDDCNDGAFSIHPGAIEMCEFNNTDQDCDGKDDEGFVDVNGDGSCSEWVYLPPMTFQMGSPSEPNLGEAGRDTDETLHTVQLTHGFFILSTEVTVAMYNRYRDPDRSPSGTECTDTTGENTCPMNRISWLETLNVANAVTAACNASATCKALSSAVTSMSSAYNTTNGTWTDPDGAGPKTGYDQTGYRLPTEAEWEYAVRAGLSDTGDVEIIDDAFYGGGITSPSACTSGGDPVMKEIGWFSCNAPLCGSTPCASPVARDPLSGGSRALPETELGLYDMSGNLYEWVWDLYKSDYPTSGTTVDPAPDSSTGARVIRGGSYLSPAEDCRSANRGSDSRTSAGKSDMGFRLVRSAIPDPVP